MVDVGTRIASFVVNRGAFSKREQWVIVCKFHRLKSVYKSNGR